MPGPWEKGGPSPNPGGRGKVAREIRENAKVHCAEAFEKVVAIMRMDGHRAQLTAALVVLRLAGVPMSAEASPEIDVTPQRPPAEIPDAELEQGLGPSGALQ